MEKYKLLTMESRFQTVFFIVAMAASIFNIRDKYFSYRVKIIIHLPKNIPFYQTTVSYEIRRLSEMDFPIYFSLYAEPGYNKSLLRKVFI